MRTIDFVNISFKNLLRNKGRTIINSLIVALGIGVLIMTGSLSKGIKEIAHKQILETRVMKEITVFQDNLSATPTQIDYSLLDELKSLDHVDLVYPDIQLAVGFYIDKEWIGVGNLRGIPQNGLPKVMLGRPYKNNERNVVIVPNKISSTKGIIDGKKLINKEIEIEYNALSPQNEQISKKYKAHVLGNYDYDKMDLPPNAIMLPIEDMVNLAAQNKGLTKDNYFKFTTFNNATVLVDQQEYVKTVSFAIEQKGFKTNSLQKELNTMPGAVRFLILIGSIISFIVLVSGTISIGATMMQTTKSRAREIGLMKAIGYFNSFVFIIFLIEAMFVGLLGGLLGLVFACVALLIIKIIISTNPMFINFSLYIPPSTLLIAFFVSLVVPYVGSLYPVFRASRLSPSEALRSE